MIYATFLPATGDSTAPAGAASAASAAASSPPVSAGAASCSVAGALAAWSLPFPPQPVSTEATIATQINALNNFLFIN